MASKPRKPARSHSNFQQQSSVSNSTMVSSVHYEGTLPHPAILRQFNEIIPNSAERLMTLAEQESLHRRELQTKTVDAIANAL